jgi:hypothetical protein
MKLLALSLAFCGAAFGQSLTPNEDLQKRLESMKLLNAPKDSWAQPLTFFAHKPEVCAIPLLNMLPAKSNVDYKIQIVKPKQSEPRPAKAPADIGIPACKQ